jgi:hypothetical protein
MDEKTTKLIKERFESLPEAVQEVILSSNYENSLLEIGQQYQLNVEQLGKLEQETTITMMGIDPLADFETRLTRELNIDKEKGSLIIKDINEKVFLRIRDLLKLMNTGELDESETGKTTEETQTKIERIDSIMPKKVDENSTKDMRTDVQTLSNAGIEIIPEKLEITGVPKPTIPTPSYAVPPKPSILEQKLSAPIKTETVTTEHSLNNITPSKPSVDPYREIPE